MRYQEGTDPSQTAYAGTQEMLVGSAVYGLLVGIGLFAAGLKTRQLWMVFWGALLTVSSLAYLGAAALGLS